MRYLNGDGSKLKLTVGKVYDVQTIPKNDLGLPRVRVLADDTGKPCSTRLHRFLVAPAQLVLL